MLRILISVAEGLAVSFGIFRDWCRNRARGEEEKPVKLEEVAEETGELIGKGVKKTWSVMKSFGKGVVDSLEEKEEQKDVAALTCPQCGASVPTNSNFCVKCGKKLCAHI